MKSILLTTIFLIGMSGLLRLNSQNIPLYPIPSYNIMVRGYANFREAYSSQNSMHTREKREINVEVRSVPGHQGCQATVWIYSLDRTIVLGPYIVNCGDILTVEVDEREWGVLVESDEEVIVDVWFSSPESKMPQGTKSKFTSGLNLFIGRGLFYQVDQNLKPCYLADVK